MKILTQRTISLVVIIFVFTSLGCAGRQIRVGFVDQELKTTDIDFTRGRQISASASGFQLLLIIPIAINSRHERAYEALRSQAGNDDYITDIKIQESWRYAFIGTLYRTTLKATAYPRKPSSN